LIARKRAEIKSKKTSKKNKSKVLTVITIIIIIAISVAAMTFYDFPEEDQKGDNAFDSGEDFVFTSLDGAEIHLNDYRGKVVILDLTATWCQPCQYQMLELKKIYENYSRDDLEILSIDMDSRETAQQLQSFKDAFKEYGYELNWVFGMDDGSIWEKYKKGGGIPTICIFDQKGKLHFSKEGICIYSEIPQGFPSDTTQLAPKIDELLT